MAVTYWPQSQIIEATVSTPTLDPGSTIHAWFIDPQMGVVVPFGVTGVKQVALADPRRASVTLRKALQQLIGPAAYRAGMRLVSGADLQIDSEVTAVVGLSGPESMRLDSTWNTLIRDLVLRDTDMAHPLTVAPDLPVNPWLSQTFSIALAYGEVTVQGQEVPADHPRFGSAPFGDEAGRRYEERTFTREDVIVSATLAEESKSARKKTGPSNSDRAFDVTDDPRLASVRVGRRQCVT